MLPSIDFLCVSSSQRAKIRIFGIMFVACYSVAKKRRKEREKKKESFMLKNFTFIRQTSERTNEEEEIIGDRKVNPSGVGISTAEPTVTVKQKKDLCDIIMENYGDSLIREKQHFPTQNDPPKIFEMKCKQKVLIL